METRGEKKESGVAQFKHVACLDCNQDKMIEIWSPIKTF